MIHYFLILQLVTSYQENRINHPNVVTYKKKLEDVKIKLDVDQLYYNQYNQLQLYDGVYGIMVYEVDKQNSQKAFVDENFKEFEEIEAIDRHTPGCLSEQRMLDVQDNLRLELNLPYNESIFYTDIAYIPTHNKAIMVRNDFRLYEIELKFTYYGLVESIKKNLEVKSFVNYLNTSESKGQLYQNPQLIHADKRIYVITEIGGVSFPDSIALNSPNFFIQQEPFKNRNIIHNIHYNSQYQLIFLACGLQGLDIYKIDNGNITYIKTYQNRDLGISEGQMNIMDVDANSELDKLYILDYLNGLLIFDLKNYANLNLPIFRIPLTRVTDFDHFESTIFIIGQTYSMQDYAAEIFVNFTSKEYYFNRYYLDEMQLYDVQVFKTYAILMGYDAHKVVFHSVYNGFILHSLESHSYFTQPQLLRVEPLIEKSENKYYDRSIIGLSKGQVKIYGVRNYPANVNCWSQDNYKKDYQIYVYAQNCDEKRSKNDSSPFSRCFLYHSISYEAKDTSFFGLGSFKLSMYVYVLLFVFVWLIIILFLMVRKWGHKIKTLILRKQKLQEQENYDKFNDGPAQNLEKKDEEEQ